MALRLGFSMAFLGLAAIVAIAGLLVGGCRFAGEEPDVPSKPPRPNIVILLADDLGYGDVGCYGQAKIRTPSIDRLAEEGMRFTQHYSGSPVCASSRCVLLTGRDTGRAIVRDNLEVGGWGPDEPEGQMPLPAGTETIATVLRRAGYRTGAFGKWGLGGPGSTGHPLRQGFDTWYGYLCQRVAHNFYPTHLWRDESRDLLGNEYFSAHQRFPEAGDPADPRAYDRYRGTVYSQDRIAEEAFEFVRDAAGDGPFFLYLAFTAPHVALQVPEDSLDEYAGAFEETPYLGGQGYLPHARPRAAYAAMITRMDREIGRLLDVLEETGVADDTLVYFSSDNGPTWAGGVDADFFGSRGGLRGMKGQLYEAGIRVPTVVRWPGRVAPGTVTDHVSAFQDLLPTAAELAGSRIPDEVDGLSFVPTLLGRDRQPQHESLYFEYHGRKSQAARVGRYKGIRDQLRRNPGAPIELYDLEADPGETTDVASRHPDVVDRVRRVLAAREPSPVAKWNFEEPVDSAGSSRP